MILLNETPLRVGWLIGKVDQLGYSATFVVKGTYELRHGSAAVIADTQMQLSGDLFERDDPSASLRYPSDFALRKGAADILLVGHAYVPQPMHVPFLRATLQVGKISKSLAVIGDRVWRSSILFAQSTDPEPFQQMELSYERSFGGRGFARNPIGRGYRKEPGTDGRPVRKLPNVEDLENLITSPSDAPTPAGFGPIPLTWPQRMSKAGTYRGSWLRNRFPWFPDDFDWTFFNAAPPDQQLATYLRGNEQIRLEHLNPSIVLLESALPGVRVRCFYAHVAGAPLSIEELSMDLDTLWIDADSQRGVLVWRGRIDLVGDELPDADHLMVIAEPLDEPPAPFETYSRLLATKVLNVQALEEVDAPLPPAGEADGKPPAEDLPRQGPSPRDREWCQRWATEKASFDGLDLSGADLSLLDLGGVSFKGAVLANARLRRAQLAGADFSDAVLVQADLSGANLRGASLANADLTDARLVAADLSHVNLRGAICEKTMLKRARLIGVQASDAVFVRANLRLADLSTACLLRANFAHAQLHSARLSSANLKQACLERIHALGLRAERAVLSDANIRGAVMWDSDLREITAPGSIWQDARLKGVDFTGANLREAEFASADLSEANLSYAELTQAKLVKASLRNAKLINANLFRATLQRADLTEANLSRANLFLADTFEIVLFKTVLEGAIVKRTLMAHR